MRKALIAAIAAVVLSGAMAGSAAASYTSAYVTAYNLTSTSCKQVFPGTCQKITLDAHGGPYYDYNFYAYYNFHFHFYGYYGSRRVRCDSYISMYEDGNYKGQYSPASCYYN